MRNVLPSSISEIQAGHINLTTLRHDPGKIVHVFDTPDRHSKPVSQLLLTSDEQHMISGGWDNHVKVSGSGRTIETQRLMKQRIAHDIGVGLEHGAGSTFFHSP